MDRNPKTLLANIIALCAFGAIGCGLLYSYWGEGIVATMLSRDLPASAKITALLEVFESCGRWAPLAYIAFVTTEVVVAPLPGLMLYAPGGILFGGFWGGLYALIGNLIGAAIACQLMRLLGAGLFGDAIQRQLNRVVPQLASRGMWLIFLLRINPLTSSDLVSYAAGLSPLPLWKILLATGLGMAPLCWMQAYMAKGLLTAFPNLIYPLLVACLIYLVIVVWTVRQLSRRSATPVFESP